MSKAIGRVGARARRGWLAALAVAWLGVAAAGCSADSDPGRGSDAATTGASVAAGSFAGRVPGTDALLALLSDGEQVAGYLCDGDDVSIWLHSDATGGDQVNLLGRDGTVHGTITVTAQAATGTIDINATPYEFTLPPAHEDAGLYRAFADLGDAGTVEAGWILLDDGTQTGAVNTRTPGGPVAVNPAPALDPDAGSVNLTRFGDLAIQHVTAGIIDKLAF